MRTYLLFIVYYIFLVTLNLIFLLNHSLPLSYTPFDPVYCSCIFPGVYPPPENEELSACLMEILSRITPSPGEMLAVGTLTARVIEGLESLALAKSTANFGVCLGNLNDISFPISGKMLTIFIF